MAYAEKVPSPSGAYWRGRYKDPGGRWITVRGEHSAVIRFDTRREAEKAADDAESDVRKGRWRDPSAGQITFAEWADEWYAGLDLAASTMANIKRHLEEHLLPVFGAEALGDIGAAAIGRWERAEKTQGYKASSVRTWRGTLHTCLEDAVGRHIAANPATRKRGRGKRAGRKADGRGPEKVITSPLGALLLAERMAILSGRDDEMVMTLAAYWCGLRLGELIGLEKTYARPKALRVEWQLHEVDGKLIRCAPKDESYGSLDLPPFLADLLAAHITRTRPEECPCHGKTYVFRGMGRPRSGGTVPLRVVAAAAGVSETAAASVLTGKGRAGEAARRAVERAARETGYVREPAPEGPAWHWRRSAFEEMFTAAASGWFPARSPLAKRTVPLEGEWPGIRVRGRNSQGRAEFCWLPVAAGLTPHGLRHSHKTWMEEARIPEVLSEERLRHEIPGISGAYRHVTPAMRRELSAAMTEAWDEALDTRLAMSARSPVSVLDNLLRSRREARTPALVPRDSPGDVSGVLPFPVNTYADLGRGGGI